MDDAAEKQFHLALVSRPQVVVEIREQIHHRLAGFERAHTQPLPGEVGDQRFGFRIGQHALHLSLQDRRIFELALRGQVD